MAIARNFSLRSSPGLCVYARGRKAGAPLCERICPIGAIHVEPVDSATPGPVIDFDSCRQCYLCAHACPVGAIEDASVEAKMEVTIRKRLRHSRHLSFRCAGRQIRDASPSAIEAVEIADQANSIVCPCLGIISHALLVLAGACGAQSISFDNRLCGGCSWRKGLFLALRAAKQAERILRLFGRELGVRFVAEELGAATEAVPQGSGISRRQFFSCVSVDFLEKPASPAANTMKPASKHAPHDRLVLNRALRLLDAPCIPSVAPGEASLWAVAATEACNNCGACAALCPTEALQFQETMKERTLVFHPVLCTGCALCIEYCPHQALQWLSPAPTNLFAYTESRATEPDHLEGITLSRAARKVCEVCARPILEGGNGRLCADCSVKQAIAISLANMEGAR